MQLSDDAASQINIVGNVSDHVDHFLLVIKLHYLPARNSQTHGLANIKTVHCQEGQVLTAF